MLKKIFSLLLIVVLLSSLTPVYADVQRSSLLDYAFAGVEEGNIFQRRYNEITGAEITSLMELGIPYYFGGKKIDKILSRAPLYNKEKCWQPTDNYKKGEFYIYGFDCSGYVQWIYDNVGLPKLDSLSNMILKYDYQENGNHLYNHRKGHEMPPYDQLKDTLQVGDLLVSKSGSRHVLMYIGTLRDFRFTAEEVPQLAPYLDYPLVIHCGGNPQYRQRFKEMIQNTDDSYLKYVNTTTGGVSVSIVGVVPEKAPEHTSKHDYFMIDDGKYALTVYDLINATSFCWFRVNP